MTGSTLLNSTVPELLLLARGKVRDIYDLDVGVMSKGTGNAQRGWSAGYAISSGRGVATELRIRALSALASMAGDDAGAFAALFDVLHDVDPAITSAVENDPIQNFAWGFRRLAAELVAGCLRWLDDPSEVVRAAAVQLLVRAGDHYREVVGALALRLADPSERVRDNAKETLAGLSHKSDLVVQLLVDALWSLNPQAQRSGAEIFAEIGPKAKAAVPVLMQVLKSPDRAARYQAALALWKIDGQVEPLIPFRIEELKDSTPKSVAGDARTTGFHYAQTFTFRDGRLERPTTTARLDAVSFLGRCGPAARTAVPALIDLLHDQDEQLQEAAVHALGDIGPAARPAVPALMQALHERWFTVRDAAAEALKRIDPEAAAKAGVK